MCVPEPVMHKDVARDSREYAGTRLHLADLQVNEDR